MFLFLYRLDTIYYIWENRSVSALPILNTNITVRLISLLSALHPSSPSLFLKSKLRKVFLPPSAVPSSVSSERDGHGVVRSVSDFDSLQLAFARFPSLIQSTSARLSNSPKDFQMMAGYSRRRTSNPGPGKMDSWM